MLGATTARPGAALTAALLGTTEQQSMGDGLVFPFPVSSIFFTIHMTAEIKLKQTNKKTLLNPNLLLNDIIFFIQNFKKHSGFNFQRKLYF